MQLTSAPSSGAAIVTMSPYLWVKPPPGAAHSHATVKAGTIPYAMGVDTAANQVYVANFSSGNVTLIDAPADASRNAWPRRYTGRN